MSYYALTDSDWPWDDEGEGRAIVVKADTPEEAIKVATEKMRAEDPHDGGIGWKVARLNLVGFEGATWELGEEPVYDGFTYYSDGINGRPDAPPSSPQPASTALVEALRELLAHTDPYRDGRGTDAEISARRRAVLALNGFDSHKLLASAKEGSGQ